MPRVELVDGNVNCYIIRSLIFPRPQQQSVIKLFLCQQDKWTLLLSYRFNLHVSYYKWNRASFYIFKSHWYLLSGKLFRSFAHFSIGFYGCLYRFVGTLCALRKLVCCPWYVSILALFIVSFPCGHLKTFLCCQLTNLFVMASGFIAYLERLCLWRYFKFSCFLLELS